MRQRFLRYTIQVPVLCKRLDQEEPAQTGTGWTEDLGEGGTCLKLPTPLLMGCRLGLVLFAEPEVVEAEARVAWVRPGGQRTFYYHGVEFVQISPPYYQSLLKTLAQGKSGEHRAFQRFPLALPISCRPVGSDVPALEGKIGNISRGGALILLPKQLLPRTKVEIALHVPNTESIRARVRWASDSSDDSGLFGHGVEFVQGPLENHRFLSLFTDDTGDKS
ncbi:MAG: PilZ domain-containing protein [Candidatus Methylomirabilales bacterium]